MIRCCVPFIFDATFLFIALCVFGDPGLTSFWGGSFKTKVIKVIRFEV